MLRFSNWIPLFQNKQTDTTVTKQTTREVTMLCDLCRLKRGSPWKQAHVLHCFFKISVLVNFRAFWSCFRTPANRVFVCFVFLLLRSVWRSACRTNSAFVINTHPREIPGSFMGPTQFLPTRIPTPASNPPTSDNNVVKIPSMRKGRHSVCLSGFIALGIAAIFPLAWEP